MSTTWAAQTGEYHTSSALPLSLQPRNHRNQIFAVHPEKVAAQQQVLTNRETNRGRRALEKPHALRRTVIRCAAPP